MSAREIYGNEIGYVQECRQRKLPTIYRAWIDMTGGCQYIMSQFATKAEALDYLRGLELESYGIKSKIIVDN